MIISPNTKNKALEKGIEPKNENDLKQVNFPIRINNFLAVDSLILIHALNFLMLRQIACLLHLKLSNKRAEIYGIKRAQWIRNLIQANLTKEPVLLECITHHSLS
jgi:hypothetical protein